MYVCVGFVMPGCFDDCVGVLVICVLVFTVFLYCFVYVYLFLFVTESELDWSHFASKLPSTTGY